MSWLCTLVQASQPKIRGCCSKIDISDIKFVFERAYWVSRPTFVLWYRCSPGLSSGLVWTRPARMIVQTCNAHARHLGLTDKLGTAGHYSPGEDQCSHKEEMSICHVIFLSLPSDFSSSITLPFFQLYPLMEIFSVKYFLITSLCMN